MECFWTDSGISQHPNPSNLSSIVGISQHPSPSNLSSILWLGLTLAVGFACTPLFTSRLSGISQHPNPSNLPPLV
eukprot:scaffold2546_cov64-Cyclotella_meneghiniana.AAC.4